MAGQTVEIVGLQDLLQKMSRMVNIDPKEVQDVLLEGATVFYEEARARAPVSETGNLRKSLRAKRGSRSRSYAMAFMASTFKIAKHGHLVEFGHKQVKGGTLKSGKGHVVGQVKAHEFFWPAVQSKVPEVEKLVLDGLQKMIEGAVK